MIEAPEQSPTVPALLTDEIRIGSAHQGPVNCVATARLGSGRVVLATAGGDGTLRRFDAATGQLLGEALGSHNRRVLTVAAATLADGRVVLAAGGDDGIVRRVDAATGRRIGSGITGHSGTVWSVAAARLPDGRAILATGGNDRTVRRFDAATGRPVGDPLTGHTDWVRCVAAATLPNGRVILATGSDDGSVRRFDAETGEPIGEPLTGHNDWVRCVAIAPLADGTVVLASGGGDGAVWRHDAATGRVIGAPLANNTRRVLSLTAIGLPDGPVVLLTGGGDGAVRCFDAATGEQLGAPMVRHEDAVLGVTAAELEDGRVILASAGAEGALVLSPLVLSGLEQPEGHGGLTVTPRPRSSDEGLEGHPAPYAPLEAVERTGSLALVDSTTGPDDLGRDVLAAHVHGMLAQLAHTQDAGTAVIHIDGRSGTGKSTVVTLLRRRLQAPAGTFGTEGAAAALLRHPVVVDYDAWREQAAGPPGLTVARALHRGVRRQRAGVTGVAMSWIGTARQSARSPLVLAPATALLVTLGLAVTARPGGLWSSAGSAGGAAVGVLAVLAATSAVVLAVGLAMAWSAAGFGRLSRLAGGGSSGELAASIARLRRWTPRRTRSQRLADTAFGLSVLLTVSWCAALLTSSAAARTSATVGARWVAGRGLALLVAAVGAAVVAGLWDWSPDTARRAAPRGRPDAAAPGRGPRVSLVALTAVALFTAFAIRTPAPVRHLVQWHPEIWTAVLLLGIGWMYAAWTARGAGLPRRPLLLVVEHLDRCPAEHVVAVLEAIHTLMREPATPRLWRRWRAPAPVGVLVAADGRWLRAAVEERYAGFDGLSSAVRGLGADFVQAVFDHTVLVPQLSAEQVQAYTAGLLRADEGQGAGPRGVPAAGTAGRRDRPSRPAGGPPGWRARRAGRGVPGVRATREHAVSAATGDRPAATGAGARPAEGGRTRAVGRLSPWISGRITGRLGADRVPAARTGPRQELAADAEPAVLDAAPEAVAARSHHLLERYSHLLPANPRMVKRVANTWGMLLALQAHLQHGEDPDTLARAAIMLVRFPALADVLLSATTAPQADPGGLTGHERSTSAWLRPDVQQVLRRDDGSVVPVERVARCYGREFARTLVP